MQKIKRQNNSEDRDSLGLLEGAVPEIGDHWNHLTRLASKYADRYRVECDCGNIIDLPIKFLAARELALRDIQTCGQRTCHLHIKIKRGGEDEEVRRRGRPKGEGGDCVRSSHYMPQQLVAAIYTVAKKTNRSYNAVLTECVREHLAAIGELNT